MDGFQTHIYRSASKYLRSAQPHHLILQVFLHERVVGAPRSSGYFCSMMGQAVLAAFEDAHGIGEEQLDKLTYMPLDGEGGITERVDK